MRHESYHGFVVWKFLAGLFLLLIAAAILFPLFARSRDNDGHSSCQSNLKQIALAYFQYTQAYNENLPPVGLVSARGDGGWSRLRYPYIKSNQLFRCPKDTFKQNAKPGSVEYTDYYMNSNFGGKNLNTMMSPSEVIILGDGEVAASDYSCSKLSACMGLNNQGMVGAIPQAVFDRHLNGSNFAFGDRHVKWVSQANVKKNEKKIFGR